MSESNGYNLGEVLAGVDAAACTYEEWYKIGAALKHEGYPCSTWDTWSASDPKRYRAGECERKWETFQGTNSPVTGGTLVAIARGQGWSPAQLAGHEISWDAMIGAGEREVIVDPAWVEDDDVPEPGEWDPAKQLAAYLECLFEAGENVGYVAQAWERDGRYLPKKGNWDRTCGELLEALGRCEGDIGRVIGDVDERAGAWIRFNPLDGGGCKNENVTDYRYALVESDVESIGKQHAIYRQLEMPIAALVHSGAKSLHAIVRIDAPNYHEYRDRVDYLYDVCKRNGLEIDAQNKNPSRLSRMPGVVRNGRKQHLVATNIGKASWSEWKEWLEEATDTLPVDVTNGDDEWDEVLVDDPQIIEGLLSVREKMMLAGGSKASKSFALLGLAVAIAGGGQWMGAACTQGDVLYVNFELKTTERKKRTRAIQIATGARREDAHRLHFLDLRGYSAPLAQLTDKIIRQTARYKCSTIIIDPIYKVMSGDENNAEAVGEFCNQLDALSRRLDCSIIYCHHYSKGQQGQKSSMDRASGSGVFARDADALLAMTELHVTKEARKAYLDGCLLRHITAWLDEHGPAGWRDSVGKGVPSDADGLRAAVAQMYDDKGEREAMNPLIGELRELERTVMEWTTAHRMESTLRAFAPRKPVNVWYRHPIHEIDSGILDDAEFADMVDLYKEKAKKGAESTQRKYEAEREKKRQMFVQAVRFAKAGEPVTRKDVADYIGEYKGKPVTESMVRNWMRAWEDEYAISGKQDGYVIVEKAASGGECQVGEG